MANSRKGIVEEEEKWGTAEGIITGEAPHRGSIIKPSVARQRLPLPYSLERPEQDIKGLTPEQVFPGYKPAIEALGKTFAMPTGREERVWPETFYSGRKAATKVPMDDITQGIVDRVVGRQDDYATRGEGRIQPQREPQPVVAPRPSLESVWGITQETLPTGATKYTLPGTEGVMTAEPRADYLGRLAAAGTTEEEQKKSYLDRLGREGEEGYQGVVAETTYREQVDRARRDQAATDTRIEEEKLQEVAGIIPRRGMAEYEYTTKLGRMTSREREGEVKATGRAREAYITGRAAREAAGIQAEGVVSAAGMKAQTEAARLGIQAADVKSKMQLRQAQMDKMLTETGLLAPMKLKLEGAKDAVSRTKIQRDTYETANKQIYDKTTKALQDKFNMGQIDAVTYDTELNALTKGFAERQDMIADKHAMEGQVHSTGVAVMRNGVWVDISGREKRE